MPEKIPAVRNTAQQLAYMVTAWSDIPSWRLKVDDVGRFSQSLSDLFEETMVEWEQETDQGLAWDAGVLLDHRTIHIWLEAKSPPSVEGRAPYFRRTVLPPVTDPLYLSQVCIDGVWQTDTRSQQVKDALWDLYEELIAFRKAGHQMGHPKGWGRSLEAQLDAVYPEYQPPQWETTVVVRRLPYVDIKRPGFDQYRGCE